MTRRSVMDDEWADRQRRAARLEPHLVGLTMAEATALVAGHDGLSVRFSATDVWTADLRPGRIDALIRDGVVVDRQTFETLPRVELSSDAVVLHDLTDR